MNPENFFNLRHTAHKQIFHNIEFVWQAIPKIKAYIKDNIQPGNKAELIGTPYIDGDVQIGEGTIIEPNVIIRGPIIIGKHCHIRQGAYLRGDVIIGDNVIVGNSTEIKNALLFNEVTVPHYNYIGDSILGFKVHLGAGVILSNTKTPMSEIKIRTIEKVYNTGLKKFGAIIGDNTEVGCNAVMNPGTILGAGCSIYPGTVFLGVAPNNAIVKNRQNQETVIKLSK